MALVMDRMRSVLTSRALCRIRSTTARTLSTISVYYIRYKCISQIFDLTGVLLALLELVQPISFTAHIQPSCVSAEKERRSLEPEYATVSGWGWTHENQAEGDRADVLRKAIVKIWSNEACERSYRALGKANSIEETQLCAGYENGQIDSCWVSMQHFSRAQMLLGEYAFIISFRPTLVAH